MALKAPKQHQQRVFAEIMTRDNPQKMLGAVLCRNFSFDRTTPTNQPIKAQKETRGFLGLDMLLGIKYGLKIILWAF